MTTPKDTTPPSQEAAQRYIDRLLEETKINERVSEIGKKINAAYRNAFKIDDDVKLVYSCYFTPNQKIIFKVSNGYNFEAFLPEIPASCVWDDADLHIAINMMTSDFTDEFIKLRNAAKKLEEEKEPTLWEKIKNWF